ncbi:RNA polymerase sigma-70 factor [Solihabitans fulvus]|uniref:RNA polymerase sigma-70 factor n=1 Tax=Solihabitans fulvus TaxID=1892852 RepID=A0A5B2WWB9_9PSEU|nr:RNA polymerase sigma-70 factor [Solihabitans fulvus]KAA2255224.1 RNA polymerase sigma-70 factor [Solihabitans fulvus]
MGESTEGQQADTLEFERHRPRLFALAYRLLGSASEAEDAVQDGFLRWHDADRAAIRTPVAWLTTVVTNLCRNRLASARARREEYVGPWLPEPVLTEDAALGPLETAEQRESVSLALLLLLERLTPAERAVFVLREAFGYGHAEIAALLDLTEANSQQLHHRARQRVASDRRRFAATREHGRRVAERFLAAARAGDLAALEQLLAEDVVATADGGGKATAARRPITGRQIVARYLSGLAAKPLPGVEIGFAEVNGQPAVVGTLAGVLLGAMALDVAENGRIVAVHIVANPDKLAYLAAQLSTR